MNTNFKADITNNPVTRQNFNDWMVPVFAPANFIPVRGKGSRIWDQNDKEYVDFAGGIAVNSLGHCHPVAVSALIDQAQKLWHIGNGYTNEPVLELAGSMVESTFADKVFFCNSGAEANEAALKLARKVGTLSGNPEKNEIISFESSFHGRTLFTVTAGGQPKYSKDFAPLPKGIQHIAFNDLDAAKAAIGPNTCAVIVEPIQGEGGVIPADVEFLKGLRQLCDAQGAVLIFDEVQTGVGRTGALYAYMNSGVTPDILTTAKALGGGFPIGAMMTTDHFANMFAVGDHGTTYGGNPLGCVVAGAVFNFVKQEHVLQGVKQREQYFLQRLNEINSKYPLFKECRGQGLLLGCELKDEYKGQAKQIVNLAAEEGLLALVAGVSVVRFTPSLIIPIEDIEEGLNRFEKALAKFQ
ncbi:bifunctional succinylornithine transaminase/acetylornithine transaminase [Acinetobacter variabilis]|jgi:succinylornithine aminotransferase|uniref:Acetylornithine aminotransferase n=1 Tax=Acinetobacter lwoffii TaxID=28090 RepID=A0AAJ3AJ07_ACILW|nr:MULTISPECIES: bifunctional succinylornithine transaminase/acetylornithine transaminase [Pseudomonadota]MCU4313010.1 bifunctional succinylornithine transaminase/acetylornithine transaminase [Acinetobacter variabilis]MCU4451056.1 bifunctional succinylornithine transaminase/acetylornithine transaminase [Acinetobacter lwoffii]MCU4615488.1 bifunctional succinylornithine transaminase/acetylornithine transaminase [Acinetobacter lwoffii]NKS47003.1 bifunctional succinylornithine transaminase/acetylor